MRSILIVTLALSLAAGAARADDRASAERYFRAGAKAYAAQNFSAAATNFEEAFKALVREAVAANGAGKRK